MEVQMTEQTFVVEHHNKTSVCVCVCVCLCVVVCAFVFVRTG